MPQIEVAFDIDADGILHVSAKDKQSGKEQKIRIEAKSGLNDQEIKAKIKEAEIHAEEDRKKKEEIEVQNEADALVFRAEKSLKEYKDRLPAPVVSDIQGKIDLLKKAIESKDISQIRSSMQELQTHMQKIGEELQKTQGQQGPSPHASQGKKPDDVEEAEAEIIEPEEKK